MAARNRNNRKGEGKAETRVVHAGVGPDPHTGGLMPTISLSSTYRREGLDDPSEWSYGRTINPTRRALEVTLAQLEGGAGCRAFASGMAAASAVLQTLQAGDEVIASSNIYGGTWRLFHGPIQRAGVQVRWVDLGDLAQLREAITERTRLVWAETPSNPLLQLTDLKAVARLLKRWEVKLVVDNTFLTPLGQSPIACGADFVIHSTTKYLNGHSDGIGGCVVSKVERDDLAIGEVQKTVGAILSPGESYSVLRGIKTLALRMERHDQNAMRIATFLSKHPKVGEVFYPGLKGHPHHRLARRQMRLHGGVVSLRLAGLPQVKRLFRRLRWFTLAESLGGVESLVNHPATMTHSSMSRAERRERGITAGLVRLSVGIEAVDDLLEDLDSALSSR